jgi:hypothetical protein
MEICLGKRLKPKERTSSSEKNDPETTMTKGRRHKRAIMLINIYETARKFSLKSILYSFFISLSLSQKRLKSSL